MPEVDKILEAQRRVRSLADELERIKQSADLFDQAEEKQEVIIRAADAIVENAGEFASEGAEIIQGLQRMDLERRLDDLHRDFKEIEALLDRQLSQLGSFLSDLKENNRDLIEASSKVTDRVHKEHEATQKAFRRTQGEAAERVEERLSKLAEHQNTLAEHQKVIRKEQRENLKALKTQNMIATASVGLLVVILIVLQFV